MIVRLDLAAMDELKEALPRFAHKPLSHLSYLRPEQVEGYWLDDIAQELTNECSTAFASYAEDRINGLVLYGDSPWDTKVVGEPVAVIKYLVGTGTDDSRVLDQLLDEVLRQAANRGTHLLTCKVQPLQFAAIHALERHGFLLMDTLLDFFFDFSRTPFEKSVRRQRLNGLHVRLANPQDLPELLALTETAFAKHFGQIQLRSANACWHGHEGICQEWVRSSFRARQIGFSSLRLTDKIAGYSVCGKRRPHWK